MADEEEDDAPDSEEPASEKPPEKPKAETKKAEPKIAEAKKDEDDAKGETKPVPKSLEWGIAIAMMVILVGFLLMMIHFMRNARSAVM